MQQISMQRREGIILQHSGRTPSDETRSTRIRKTTRRTSLRLGGACFPAQTLFSKAIGFIESKPRVASSPLFHHLQ